MSEVEEMSVEEYRARYGDGGERPAKRRNKYNARKVRYDGYVFDSQAEHRRYLYLKSEQEAGRISYLTVHPVFEVSPAFTDRFGQWYEAITYEADFRYCDAAGWWIVEDVKGRKATQTSLWKLKWALVARAHPNLWFRVVES